MKVASYKHHLKKRKKRNPLNRVLLFTAIFFFNLNNTAMPSSGQPFSQEPPQTAQDFQQSHTLFRRLVFVYQSHRIISVIWTFLMLYHFIWFYVYHIRWKIPHFKVVGRNCHKFLFTIIVSLLRNSVIPFGKEKYSQGALLPIAS